MPDDMAAAAAVVVPQTLGEDRRDGCLHSARSPPCDSARTARQAFLSSPLKGITATEGGGDFEGVVAAVQLGLSGLVIDAGGVVVILSVLSDWLRGDGVGHVDHS